MLPYKPIACHLHDIYEIAIMRATPLRLTWRQGDEGHCEIVQALDLRVADGAEWLLVENSSGERLSIRLDWIRRAHPVE